MDAGALIDELDRAATVFIATQAVHVPDCNSTCVFRRSGVHAVLRIRLAMRRRIWLCFLCGFVATFCLLAASITRYAMLPSGEGVAPVKLWRFYVNEWPRFFAARPVAAASANQDALLTVTLQHIALSTVGGLAAAAAAVGLQRRARKVV
jgi:hypothetical protein